jgi:hypothetical protein
MKKIIKSKPIKPDYSFDKLPINPKTREGIQETINQLGCVGRMLSMQDNYFEELFEGLNTSLITINKTLATLVGQMAEVKEELANHEDRIGCNEKEIAGIKREVEELQRLIA